ncbi:unnamed protein product [Allacma fusca]|uniref:Uncharacterized protein n=1 Tax=Allacma fusca TaxID=39272 RepID=A0A8J2P9T9_9HEXA|nr:unnamed protein product [Allacma fusca]
MLMVLDVIYYYLTHHAIIKGSNSTTKCRIVFEGTNVLGEFIHITHGPLMSDPVLQDDLHAVLVHWRFLKVALVADIKHMYLQIWVHPQHRDFLRILWREEPSHKEALQLCQDLMTLASQANFTLRKWSTSHPQVQETIPEEMRENSSGPTMDTEKLQNP